MADILDIVTKIDLSLLKTQKDTLVSIRHSKTHQFLASEEEDLDGVINLLDNLHDALENV